jgi:hypothetical protein
VKAASITPRQYAFLMLILILPTAAEGVPSYLLPHVGKDAFWALLLAGAGALVPTSLVAASLPYLPRRLPGRGFSRRLVWAYLLVLETVLVLSLTGIWGELFVPVRELLLHDTPLLAVVLPSFLVAWYIAAAGLLPQTEMSEVLGPVLALSVVVFALLALRFLDWNYALPLGPVSGGTLASAGAYAYTFLAEVAYGAYLGRYVEDRRAAARALFQVQLAVVVLLFLTTGVPLLFYGPWLGARLSYPFSAAARSIHYGFIVEHLDLVRRLLGIATVVLKCAATGWLAADPVHQLSRGRIPMAPLTGVVLGATGAVALWLFHGHVDLRAYLAGTWSLIAAPSFTALALGAFLLSRLRGGRSVRAARV